MAPRGSVKTGAVHGERGKNSRNEAAEEKSKTKKELIIELKDLRERLKETKNLLTALQKGNFDIPSFPTGVYTQRGSDHIYRQIFGKMNEGALVLFSDGTIVYNNSRFAELVERPLPKVVGSKVFRFIPIEHIQTAEDILEAAKNRRNWQGEFQLKSDDGKLIPVRFSMAPVFGTNSVNCAIITNLTEYKRKEEELKKLTTELIAVQEKERKRIAGEIHDTIGATLAAIRFKIKDVLQTKLGMDFGEPLQEVAKMVDECAEDTRRMQMDLRPPMLDDLGIVAALTWHCRRFSTIYTNIRLETRFDLQDNEVPNTLRTVIYRISQEALNNVAKHSAATEVSLSLRKSNSTVELNIRDNGRGFDKDSILSQENAGQGLGLSTMKERAALSGGLFHLESAVGKGTLIRASWPMNR